MIRIFIEAGKRSTSEFVFCESVLKHWGFPKECYCIEPVGGKDNLRNVLPLFRDNTLQNGVNVILFDADSFDNGGGFSKRLGELKMTLKESGVDAEIFLFPNNRDDGDFETMLEQLIQSDRHGAMLGCFRDYELCLPKQYVSPNRKGRLHTYISAMPMCSSMRRRLGQGEWQFENAEYWNLDHEYLYPMKTFFEKIFHTHYSQFDKD